MEFATLLLTFFGNITVNCPIPVGRDKLTEEEEREALRIHAILTHVNTHGSIGFRRFLEDMTGIPRISIYDISPDLTRIQRNIEEDPSYFFNLNPEHCIEALTWVRNMQNALAQHNLPLLLRYGREYLSAYLFCSSPAMIDDKKTYAIASLFYPS